MSIICPFAITTSGSRTAALDATRATAISEYANSMNPIRRFYPNGQLRKEIWFQDGKFNRVAGPADRRWYQSGQLRYEIWYKNFEHHRVGGPSYRDWSESGQLRYESWCLDGKLHRVDPPGPAWWGSYGSLTSKTWSVHGKRVHNLQRYLTRRGLIQ